MARAFLLPLVFVNSILAARDLLHIRETMQHGHGLEETQKEALAEEQEEAHAQAQSQGRKKIMLGNEFR